MIIISLSGGLGNQMFQYAAARYLAEKHSTILKLDPSSFESSKQRKYSLHCFNIQENLATQDEINTLLKYPRNKTEILLEKINRRIGIKSQASKNFVREKFFHFDPYILEVPNDVYLYGFWQSEKYFLDIEEILRREFTLKYPQTCLFQEVSELMNSSCSISLHIRRGDYVNVPELNMLHGVCNLDYYQRAIDYIAEQTHQPHFFVFSDDPAWVKESLSFKFPITLISDNSSFHDYEELYLMSRCKHHIIANSSFSWWGAWLNPNPEKITIAPIQWFNNYEHNTEDLIPDSWLRL